MRVLPSIFGLLLGGLLGKEPQTTASPTQAAQPYNLRVSVEAVSLTFQVLDANGRPIDDLKPTEMGLFDNGRSPRKIIAFQFLKNFPSVPASSWISAPPCSQLAQESGRSLLNMRSSSYASGPIRLS